MTDDDIKEACQRFIDYLQANGSRTLAMNLYVDTTGRQCVVTSGIREMQDEMCITTLAIQRGFRLSSL